MIYQRALHMILEKKDANGKPKAFSFVFVKKSTGEVIRVLDAICTSFDYKKRCINVKVSGSEEIRTIRTLTIIEFNDQEVVI
jgi:hypothetical protein